MRTVIQYTRIAIVLFLLISQNICAETPVHCCTVVEVTDGTYNDKLWMITEPGTTDGFDNGWDGYKFISSATHIPQIYDKSVDGNFQVSSFPSIDNKVFAFLPGNATNYKLNFNHYDITYFYTALYLVDMLKGDTIDIYANKSGYSFTAAKGDMLLRFKFITKLPEKPVTTPDVTTTVLPPIPQDTMIVIPTGGAKQDGIISLTKLTTTGKSEINSEQIKNKAELVKVTALSNTLKVSNRSLDIARLQLINAMTGQVLTEVNVESGTEREIGLNGRKGVFIIRTFVAKYSAVNSVLIQ